MIIAGRHNGDLMFKKNKTYKVIVKGLREEKIQSVTEPVVYHLPAENREQAITAAMEKFGADYQNLIEVKAAIKHKEFIIVSIVCLVVACFLSFILWYLPDGSMLSINPISLIPFLFSIVIYYGAFIRGKGFLKRLKNAFLNGVLEAIGSIFIIAFIASFVRLLSDGNIQVFSLKIPLWGRFSFDLPIMGMHLLIFGAMFSLLGIAIVAKIIWIAIFLLVVFRLRPADSAMGIWGMVYIFSGFLGIVLHLLNNTFLQTLNLGFISGDGKERKVDTIEKEEGY
jgi:hypothetical protein